MEPHRLDSQDHHCHDASHPSHVHDDPLHQGTHSLSKREKMVMRLAYYVRHNSEHGDFFEQLADEVAEQGTGEAAQQIRAAAAYTKRQNEHLENALKLLNSR
jgi:hypothetical protein